MIDKHYCMSSYLAFRYVKEKNVQFVEGTQHQVYEALSDEEKTLVYSVDDIDASLEVALTEVNRGQTGLLLSGGMDSAILASYLHGCRAYTFRFLGGSFQQEELKRAEYYANYYGLDLRYVDIDWASVDEVLDIVMKKKGAPVHSIEPQIYIAALQAKTEGINQMVIGNGSDYVFGGMDKLLSKDWTYDDFVQRYMYINPSEVLVNPVDLDYVFRKYYIKDGLIDYVKLLDEMAVEESYASYDNAFAAAGMSYIDPYASLKMAHPLDLSRIRSGESKYMIRALFKRKYPEMPVPEKVPMPRPVDLYFKDWPGPKRSEFLHTLKIEQFSGNQKWLIYCLERFLNLIGI